MVKIMIVDDDPAIRDVLRFACERAGWLTMQAADGPAALAGIAAVSPDLVVLDIAMPGLDGIEVCRQLRRTGNLPVIFLTARDEEVERIVGLEIGADDYITKPFSPREVVARIKTVLRRATPVPVEVGALVRYGRLTLDPNTLKVRWDGAEVTLTATELGILRTLLRHPGKVYDRDSLMDGAYATARTVSDRTIDSHIRRLRARFAVIGASPIETVAGFGYRLAPPS